MKALHWTDFAPTDSKVNAWMGGIHPKLTFDRFKNGNEGFCAITYQLQVNAAHNGWHHFMGMFTAIQGVAFSNACVKTACRPGSYQMVLHFDMPKPHIVDPAASSDVNYYENSYSQSMFMGQDNPNYGTNQYWVNGNLMDVMVFRPSLVDPTNCNNRVDLWNSAAYDGWIPFFTGFPLFTPENVATTYEL